MPHRSPSSFDFTAIETLVRQHFLHIITKVAGLAHLIDFDPSQPLDISQYPVAQRALDKLLQQLHNDLSVGISSSMWQAWETANDKMDALVLKHLPKAPDAYFLRNHEALQALLSRKERGLDLSQRVWRITQQFEEEVTMALDLGLRNGEDAATLARTLRQHLNQPDKLFRRVRDEHGMLHLSKRAKTYHPGQGVYRSSFKNARRLAATETNMAYCTADYERWQQLDFVVGIRIELSNNHTCLGADGKPHRFHDICDDLQGKYPKDFKFTGWHPHCRCHATPILKTPEEMDRDDEAILRGERPSSESQNTVHTPPPALDKWMEKNKDRIAASKARGALPYFIKDNKAVFGLEEKKKTPLDIAKERHAKRTKAQEEEIRRRWEERKKNLSAVIRSQVRQKANSLLNTEFRHPKLNKGIILSAKRIKEWLNQPHQNYNAKNLALLRVDEIISNASYVGNLIDKHNPTVTTHILETTGIGNSSSWIILREFPSESIIRLHSVSDSPKIKEIAQ